MDKANRNKLNHDTSMIDIDEQIRKHKEWILIVKNLYKQGSRAKDLSNLISDHNACELGKWILSPEESHKLLNNEYFIRLRETHKTFHETAGIIAVFIQKNNHHDAKRMEQEFDELSNDVIVLLKDLKASLA